MGAAANGFQNLVGSHGQLQARHLVARHHAIGHLLARKTKDIFHQVGLLRFEDAGFLGVLDHQQKFFHGVHHLFAVGMLIAEQAQNDIGRAAHEQGQRPREPGEDHQRRC